MALKANRGLFDQKATIKELQTQLSEVKEKLKKYVRLYVSFYLNFRTF